MNKLVIFPLLFFLPVFVSAQANLVIHPGNILEDLNSGAVVSVETSKKEDIIQQFGDSYLPISGNGRYRMVYEDLGLTFFYVNKPDTVSEIYYILIESPAKAYTSDGVVILGKTRMAEVIKSYGHGRWGTTTGGDYWDLSYKDMTLSVEKDKSLPEFPLDEMAHIKKPIVQIMLKCANEDHNYYMMHY